MEEKEKAKEVEELQLKVLTIRRRKEELQQKLKQINVKREEERLLELEREPGKDTVSRDEEEQINSGPPLVGSCSGSSRSEMSLQDDLRMKSKTNQRRKKMMQLQARGGACGGVVPFSVFFVFSVGLVTWILLLCGLCALWVSPCVRYFFLLRCWFAIFSALADFLALWEVALVAVARSHAGLGRVFSRSSFFLSFT